MVDADWGGQPGSRLGLDIGGTLAKLVFFESETRPSWCNGRIAEVIKSLGKSPGNGGEQRGTARQPWGECDVELSFADAELGGTFHFLTFRSDQMERFVALVEKHELHTGLKEILATGGGAYKYAALFRERLGVELRPVDELGVVVQGIAWLVDRPIRETMCFLDCPSSAASPEASNRAHEESSPRRSCLQHGAKALFPFLLVNIGSGVSVVRVDGLKQFQRVSGSAIGGGTFWGLCQLLCPDCTAFGDAGRLAEQGNASSVNLLVEDIYGGDYTMPNGAVLPGSLTASFFAKAATGAGGASCGNAQTGRAGPDAAALLHALTKMVSSNICQIAYLNARLHSVPRIVFTGNFLRQNPVARQAISENMARVSAAHPGQEPYRALFLHHEGYFGALGTFLNNVQEEHGSIPSCSRMASKRAQLEEEEAALARASEEEACEKPRGGPRLPKPGLLWSRKRHVPEVVPVTEVPEVPSGCGWRGLLSASRRRAPGWLAAAAKPGQQEGHRGRAEDSLGVPLTPQPIA